MSEWIKCSERLPDDGVYVLVVCQGVVQFDTARVSSPISDHEPFEPSGIKVWGWRQDWADDAPIDAVSHWMPLPRPPVI